MDMDAPRGSEGKAVRCPGCGGVFTCRLPVAEVIEAVPLEPEGEMLLTDEVPETAPAAFKPIDQLDEEELAELDEAAESVADILARAVRDKPKRVVKENPRQWCVMVGGVAAVALTFEELRERAASGQLKPKTKILYAPRNVTVRARDIPGLFGGAEAGRTRQADKPEEPRRRRKAPPAGADAPAAAAVADALSRLGGGPNGEAEDAPERDEAAEALRRLGEAAEDAGEQGDA